ncbi:MAG TPA: VOC family protein [Steroidobacteraceae bacterium]|jgi:catechol 2,3-dioxygenase-like lactoylglutathione lyase family enzyme/diadenosine tetraphosphate (Ap4A) HIT family hydrolase
MPTAIHRLVESCRAGTEPGVVARMASGWAVMGQRQVLEGYCLLLPDPVVPHLNALQAPARDLFLSDLGKLGDAVLVATGALRINYAIFGNLEPALHAHVHPRFTDEPETLRTANPWGYDWSKAPAFDPYRHGALRDSIRQRLGAAGGIASSEQPDGASDLVQPGAGTIHHLDVTVSDLARSTAFYERWLPQMGLVRVADCAEGPLWRGSGFELGLQQAGVGLATRPHVRQAVGLHHLAFTAPSRAAVTKLHTELQLADMVILDTPAEYPDYAQQYFAVFFADPDGIKLEYVYSPL